jgi:hypothetical protein
MDKSRTAVRLAWAGLVILGLATLAWPHLAGAVLLSDDAQLLYVHLPEPMFFHGWNSPTGFFRPIEIVSAYLSDPNTRDARVSLLLHLPAIAALLAAILVALRRATPDWRVAFPIAVLWWVLNVATAINIWQPDTISQSWSGAVGAWTALLAWIGIDHAREGRLSGRHIAAFIALCIAGVFTKEFFVGWATGTVVMVIIAFVSSTRSGRSHVTQWLSLSIPPAVVAIGFVVLRLSTNALDIGTGEYRYDVALGLNVVENVAIATAGFLAVGPSHLTTAPDASIVARLAAPIGALLTGLILLAGAVHLVRRWRSVDWSVPVYAVLMAFAAIGPALVTHHVSEYYLFGPNAIVACLVGASAAWLLRRTWSRPGAALAIGLVAVWTVIALFGAYARAQSIATHWDQIRIIDAEVRQILASAEPGSRIQIVFPAEMSEGTRHGVFRSTPTHMYDLPLTGEFLSESSDDLEVILVEGPAEPRAGWEQVILDVDIPSRQRW